MEVTTFIQRVNEICAQYKSPGQCRRCPLKPYGCGFPKDISMIPEIEKIIDEHRIVRCQECFKVIGEYILEKYGATHCPWCGEPIPEAVLKRYPKKEEKDGKK